MIRLLWLHIRFISEEILTWNVRNGDYYQGLYAAQRKTIFGLFLDLFDYLKHWAVFAHIVPVHYCTVDISAHADWKKSFLQVCCGQPFWIFVEVKLMPFIRKTKAGAFIEVSFCTHWETVIMIRACRCENVDARLLFQLWWVVLLSQPALSCPLVLSEASLG